MHTRIWIVLLLLLGASCSPRTVPGGEGCDGYHVAGSLVMLFDDTVVGADPSTFECLANEYGRDRDHVFFGSRLMPVIDAASFEVLPSGYSKDQDQVYYGYYSGQIIQGADPSTFEVFDLTMTKDRQTVYCWDDLDTIVHLDSVDPTSFRRFGSCYRDKDHVFYCNGEVFAGEGEYSEAELRELCQVDGR